MVKLMQKQAKIVRDGLMGRSARIVGTRIRVRDVVEKYVVVKESPAMIAKEFRIAVSDVHEALAYYYEHLEEVREEIKRDREFVEKFMKELGKHEIPSRRAY